MLRTSLVFFIMAFTLCVFSQDGNTYVTRKNAPDKAKKYFEKGMELVRNGTYDKALKQFEKAASAEAKFVDAYIQQAYIYYDKDEYTRAETLMENVVKMAPDYKPIVIYRLGLVQLKLKKFDKAAKNFQRYLDAGSGNERQLEKAKKHLANCNFAMTAIKNPVEFKPETLGENVNTLHSEYLPSFTADGGILIFTRRIAGNEDFYMSKKKDGKWQKSEPINAINTQLNEGAQAIRSDGKFMVFTACNRKDGIGSCDLYFSEVKDGDWTKPANMGAPVNTRSWESQPSLSADGKTLYFARKVGENNIDIYVSKRLPDGSWTVPASIGEPVNSPAEDESPFIHPDGQTLYFMSKGHPGVGGHDLFLSRRQEDQSWGEPVNLGYPINTEASEGALVISLDGQTAYFASDRGTGTAGEDKSAFEMGGKGHTDLYSFNLPEAARPKAVTFVKARVFDAETKETLSADISFLELASGEEFASTQTEDDGEFLVCLPIGKNYSLNVFKEKYLFHSENFSLAEKDLTTEKPYILEIGLKKIEAAVASGTNANAEKEEYVIGKAIVLKNVFFDTGSANLRSESFPELLQLKKLLQDNETISIQLNGHTDNVGSDADNLKLSDNRAKAVYDFLVNEGIKVSRLTYKGFGEQYPVSGNESEDGRQQNRRTEFIVIGKE